MTKLEFVSYGKKYHESIDADYSIDARNLRNPYYVDELKHKTGLDMEVKKYILEDEESKKELIRVIIDLNTFLDSHPNKDLVIGVYCTGGHHRSVTLASFLADYYSKQYTTKVRHLDISEEN